MCLAVESQGRNAFNLTAHQTVSINSILVDEAQQEFFRRLGALVAEGGRIDILACDLAAGEYGPMLIDVLGELTGVNVAASTDATGNTEKGGNWVLERGGGDAGERYFNNSRLCLYEGLLANPSMVKDINTSGYGLYASRNISIVGSTVFFDANDGTSGWELWKSDGTVDGTVLVKDINPGAGSGYPEGLNNVNGILYFNANNGTDGMELWKSDGTSGGTVMVKNINPAGSGLFWMFHMATVEDTLYFAANDGTNGWELWRSDGTSGGTVMVKDINTGGDGIAPFDFKIITLGKTVYFAGDDGTNGMELWRSNGTSAGTYMVKDIYAGSNGGYPRYPINVNDTLYFTAGDAINGGELWKSDGTVGGTVLVKDIRPGINWSNINSFANVNGMIFFSANDGTNGQELWKTDGTESGTVMVKDIYPGDNWEGPRNLVNMNGSLYFSANDNANGRELWKSDGTSGGTVMVKDIWPGAGSSNIDTLVVVNDMLYFGADNGTLGKELWASDGTSGGTVLVQDIWPGLGSGRPGKFAAANNTLYFAADDSVHSTELWKYEIGLAYDNLLVYMPDSSLVGPGAFPGDTVSIPVYLDAIEYGNHNGIYSFQFGLTYSNASFECIGYDSSGTVLGNWGGLSGYNVQFHRNAGLPGGRDTLFIAGASDDSLYYNEVPGTPFAFPRPLIKLRYRISPTVSSGDSTELHFLLGAPSLGVPKLILNEGVPGVSVNNGSIKIGLRMYGDVDQNGLIQPFDAVLVLRHVIRDTTLGATGQIAAEVSGNGEITAYDAALILMYYVGKITTFPVGDYFKRALPSNRGAELALEWGELKDGMLTLLVNAKNLTEVYGYSMELAYDPAALVFQGAGLTDFTQGMINVIKTEDGLIRFAAAGSDPIEGDGALVRLTFRVTGEVSGEDIIQLTEMILNEELVISNASSASVPKTYALEQNYPNPFNPTTHIRYQIPEGSQVSLTIYNMLGQKVRTLVNGQQAAGVYDIVWDGTNDNGVKLASGVYIYRMTAGNFTQIRKLVLMK